MKKLLKRAVMMMAALAIMIGAVAQGPMAVSAAQTFTITVPGTDDHQYGVYQIFTGDLAKDGVTLSNLKAGSSYKGTNTPAGVKQAAKAIEALKTAGKTDSEILAEIEKYVDFTKAIGTVDKNKPLANLPAGYYLVRDVVGGTLAAGDAYTLYIVQIVNNITIARKADVPTFEKKSKNYQPSTKSYDDWDIVGDYSLGDVILYQLKGTLPDNYKDYTKYFYTFHDTMSKGLTLDQNSIAVKIVDGKGTEHKLTKTTNFSVDVKTTAASETELTVDLGDLKKLAYVDKDAVVYVTYSAKLNEKSIIGNPGNDNKAHLEFSNNPNDRTGNEKTDTPDDKTKSYTFKLNINKKDDKGQKLNGAGFTLYRIEDGKEVAVGKEVVNLTGNTFSWERLGAGQYVLKETTTPDGYNTMDNLKFTINAIYGPDGTLMGLSATVDAAKGATTAIGQDGFKADVASGTLTGDIINEKGLILPTTGTVGLVIMVAGVAMMLGVAVILRKKSAKASN